MLMGPNTNIFGTPGVPEVPDACTDAERQEFHEEMRRRARAIYGDRLPIQVWIRLVREWERIKFRYDWLFIPLLRAGDYLATHHYPVSAGNIGPLFIAWLMGLSDINPLPPHYVCDDCRHSEFDVPHGIHVGLDLPGKDCPECGKPMRRDGFNLSWCMFFYPDMASVIPQFPRLDFGVPEEAVESAYQALSNQFPAQCRCYDSLFPHVTWGDAPLPRMLFVPRGQSIEQYTGGIESIHGKRFSVMNDMWGLRDDVAGIQILLKKTLSLLCILHRTTGFENEADALQSDDIRRALISDIMCGKLYCGFKHLTCENCDYFPKTVSQLTSIETTGDFIGLMGMFIGTGVWNETTRSLLRDGVPLRDCIASSDDVYHLLREYDPPRMAFKMMKRIQHGRGMPNVWRPLNRKEAPVWLKDFCDGVRRLSPRCRCCSDAMLLLRLAWFEKYHPDDFKNVQQEFLYARAFPSAGENQREKEDIGA